MISQKYYSVKVYKRLRHSIIARLFEVSIFLVCEWWSVRKDSNIASWTNIEQPPIITTTMQRDAKHFWLFFGRLRFTGEYKWLNWRIGWGEILIIYFSAAFFPATIEKNKLAEIVAGASVNDFSEENLNNLDSKQQWQKNGQQKRKRRVSPSQTKLMRAIWSPGKIKLQYLELKIVELRNKKNRHPKWFSHNFWEFIIKINIDLTY